MLSQLIKKSDIQEELRLIKESDRDYITPTGKIYCDYGDGLFYPKKTYINKHNGYVYVGIHCSDGEQRSRRLHRLLADAYIPNPNNYPCVMHIDNNKQNCSLDNLKWGTVSENTQQAFDDGLIVNAKGFEDSQSKPINYYNLYTTELIKEYGSITEASKDLNISKGSIIHSCEERYKDVRKPYYFRYASDGNIDIPNCIGAYDYNTDELVGMYYNCANASKENNISEKTISNQVLNNRKPKYRNDNGLYFLAICR